MEKRILVAFLLSFIVFFAWSAINPPPQRPAPRQNSEQVVDNKQLKTESISTPTAVVLEDPKTVVAEDIRILENDLIRVELSNIGGSINKVTVKKFDVSLPVTQIYHVAGLQTMPFAVISQTGTTIVYEYKQGNAVLQKSYSLSPNDYLIRANVQTKGMSNLGIGAYHVDASLVDPKVFQSPQKSLFEYSVGLINQIVRKDNALEFSEKDRRDQPAEVSWIGFRNQYYCLIVKPDFKTSRLVTDPQGKKDLRVEVFPIDSNLNSYSADIYVGPQNMGTLSGYKKGFENILVFSNWGVLDFFAKIIYSFVHFLGGILKNWGVAIIVLGLVIYGATYPLTAKSMASMRKMQLLQPQMKALQEKYKSDPQRMNKEMMELYKEHGVNPMGGCLPMLLQMPIFYGLYQVLWRSETFKGAEFLWIKDLSEPDRLSSLPVALPFLGSDLNILPIAMAVIMFFQQKFTSRNMVITDENQLMQQKMMLILMPLMMGFIFYNFASGLSLYFTTFYLLSAATQWKMSKLTEPVK